MFLVKGNWIENVIGDWEDYVEGLGVMVVYFFEY